jgi:hypothetical protein
MRISRRNDYRRDTMAGPLLPPDEQGDFLITASARQLAAADSDSWSWITSAARPGPHRSLPGSTAGFPRAAAWPVGRDRGLRPVAAVRASARAILQRWGITERGDDIVLVLSELLANALLHAARVPAAGASRPACSSPPPAPASCAPSPTPARTCPRRARPARAASRAGGCTSSRSSASSADTCPARPGRSPGRCSAMPPACRAGHASPARPAAAGPSPTRRCSPGSCTGSAHGDRTAGGARGCQPGPRPRGESDWPRATLTYPPA